MPKHSSSSVKSLFDQSKDNKINQFLQSVPCLTFSEKGLKHIAKRSNITGLQLSQKIKEFEEGGCGHG